MRRKGDEIEAGDSLPLGCGALNHRLYPRLPVSLFACNVPLFLVCCPWLIWCGCLRVSVQVWTKPSAMKHGHSATSPSRNARCQPIAGQSPARPATSTRLWLPCRPPAATQQAVATVGYLQSAMPGAPRPSFSLITSANDICEMSR